MSCVLHDLTETEGKIHKTTCTQRGGGKPVGAPPPIATVHSLSYQPKQKGTTKARFAADECDTDSVSPPPTRISKRKWKHEDRDPNTNVLMIKFGVLSKPCKVHTGDPVVCSNDQCAAILNHHSKITKEAGGEGDVRVCAVFRLCS